MSTVVILQLMFISIGMTILGFVLNKILGIKKQNFIDLRKNAQSLQERMKNAQATRDVQMMMQLQQESVKLMKKLLKKQVIPLCLRCSLFIGIFIVLGFIYRDYSSGLLPFPIPFLGDGWLVIYFLFSLSFALIIYGIRKLYKKLAGKETQTQNQLKNIIKILSPNQQSSASSYQFGGPMPSQPQYQLNIQNISSSVEENQQTSKKDNSWKERIEK